MLIPLFLLLTRINLVSTYPGATLVYAGLLTPFSIYLLTNFFRTIPHEIVESALMDGASSLQILALILLPLSGPALHRWWYRCLTHAGVVDEGTTRGKKMHGARYTSGTEFYLATGDIYATQQLLGHADVSTTANIYVQGSPADLEEKLRKVWGK